MSVPDIDVLLCTYRRAALAEAVRSVQRQRIAPGSTVRIVVADNDVTPSARALVEGLAREGPFPVVYLHAPARNISIARNAGLDASSAEWIAFLDDDEEADPLWLTELLRGAAETGADAVFGPAHADYADEAPAWMRRQDHHSNLPVRRGGMVETGHTCNALLRWRGTAWQDERFELRRGRSGGEDTEFFLRLHRQGARFAIRDEAVVRERVAPERLRLRWLMRRKYRMGQSYAASAAGPAARTRLAATAAAKAAVCGGAVVVATSADRRNFWLLRMTLHAGVAAGCLDLRQPELYGAADKERANG